MNKLQASILTLLVCLACVAGALYYQKLTARGKYHATTKFQILQEPPAVFSAVPHTLKGGGGNWMDEQIVLISSPTVLTRVVKLLNLDAEWHMTPEKALERVQKRVEVTGDRGTKIVSVTGWGNSPESAADLANSVRKMYEEVRTEAEQDRFRRLTENVEAKIRQQKKTVEAAKAQMEALQKKHGITGEATPPPGQPEYASTRQNFESAMALLNQMRELSDRQKVDEAVVRKRIEILEEARPQSP
jgi:uncharacterized protein involved in exopolysaccharide biosynthesis